MWKGFIVAAMRQVFEESSEHHTVVHRKPEIKVTVTEDFAVGDFTLVAVSASVAVVIAANAAKSSNTPKVVSVGELFNLQGKTYVGQVSKNLSFPQAQKSTSDSAGAAAPTKGASIVSFWAVDTTISAEDANLKFEMKPCKISVGTWQATVNVPTFQNTKALANGDKVVALWKDGGDEKRRKIAEDDEDKPGVTKKDKKQGKGKGKGVGAGKVAAAQKPIKKK